MREIFEMLKLAAMVVAELMAKVLDLMGGNNENI